MILPVFSSCPRLLAVLLLASLGGCGYFVFHYYRLRDLTGGGANLKLGQHLVLPKDTPLCNVWLTMLNGMGINVERHGDSTGVVKELQA